VKSLGESIKSGIENRMIEVLTVSLSPECCGSWKNAERMLEKFAHIFQLKIKLN